MQRPLTEQQLGSPVTDSTVQVTGITRMSHGALQFCSLVIWKVGPLPEQASQTCRMLSPPTATCCAPPAAYACAGRCAPDPPALPMLDCHVSLRPLWVPR